MASITISQIETEAKKRGVPVYVVLDEIIFNQSIKLN